MQGFARKHQLAIRGKDIDSVIVLVHMKSPLEEETFWQDVDSEARHNANRNVHANCASLSDEADRENAFLSAVHQGGLALAPGFDVNVCWLHVDAERLILNHSHGASSIQDHQKGASFTLRRSLAHIDALEGSYTGWVHVVCNSGVSYPVNVDRGSVVTSSRLTSLNRALEWRGLA